MADVLLTFGVTPESSAAIQSAIQRIVNGLNPKIRIDVDTARAGHKELSELDRFLKGIYDDLNKIGDSSNSNLKNVSNQLGSIAKSANGLRGALLGNNGVGLEQFTFKLQSLKAKADELRMTLARTGQDKFFVSYKKDTSEFNDALGKVESRIRQVQGLRDGLKEGKFVNVDPDAIKKLDALEQRLTSIRSSLDGMPVETFKTVMSSVKNGFDAIKDTTTKANAIFAPNTKEYEVALGRLEQKMREVMSIQSELQNGTKTTDSATAQQINDVASGFNTLEASLKSGKAATADFEAEFARLSRELSGLTPKLETPIKFLKDDPTELANSMNNVQRMLNTIADLKDRIATGKSIADPQTVSEINNMDSALQKFAMDMEHMSAEEAAEKIAGFRLEVTRLQGSFKSVGSLGSLFSQFFSVEGLTAGITGALSRLLSWPMIIMKTIQEIKQMVNEAIELNSAFTQLQIVTRASDEEMETFSRTLIETSKNMSASVKDMTEVATVYSRLGYSLEESNVLAQYTAMLQNVGDIDASAASDALTAIVKAFRMDVNDIESIMDKMVAVGNNAPISVSQIAEGMNNAASIMANAGMKFDQSVALLTAANTTTQNISKSSTAVRTIIARLRNMKTELDEAGEVWSEAKYQELVSALTMGGVQLQDAAGELRNPYEILRDLAAQWDSLSSNAQAAITTALAGTRQQDVFNSIIRNFGEATNAMNEMAGSAGALTDAYSVFTESMQGHINVFKASFQELSYDLIPEDLVNTLVDLGTSFIELLDQIVQLVDTLFGTQIRGGIDAIKLLSDNLSNIADLLSRINSTIKGINSPILKDLIGIISGGAFRGQIKSAITLLERLMTIAGISFESAKDVAEETSSAYKSAYRDSEYYMSLIQGKKEGTSRPNNHDGYGGDLEHVGDGDGSLLGFIKSVKAGSDGAIDGLERLSGSIDDVSREAEAADGPLSNLSDKYVTLSEAINGSKKAMDALSEAMGENADEGYEQRVKAFDAINEAFENGEVGSMSNVWSIAEALGASQEVLDEFDPQKLYDWCEQTAQYFTEGQDGVNNFLDAINENEDALNLFKEFSWDGENLNFDIDNSNLPKLAEILGLNSDALWDIITRLGQYYRIQVQTPQDLLTYMQNLSVQTGTVDEKLAAARLALEQLSELTGEEINIAKIDSGELGAEDFTGTTREIVQAYLDMKKQLSEGGETGGVSLELKLDDQQFQVNLDADEEKLKAICGEDMWNVVLGMSSESLSTEEKLNTITELMNTIDASKVTATVKDGTGTVKSSLWSVVNYLTQVKNNNFQTVTIHYKTSGTIPQYSFASGTKKAKAGTALLGDEYSPTGQPKPELVVSAKTGKAYVAGVNGPVMAKLNSGDVVYTADETQRILSSANGVGSIPAYGTGTGSTWTGGGFRQKLTTTTSSSSSSGSSSGKSSSYSSYTTSVGNWFEEEYARHNHLVKMCQEDMYDYLKWLDEAYQKAYNQGIIDLDAYRQYQEEVFTGLQDLFKDYLNDLDHDVSMREHFDKETNNIILIWKDAVEKISEEVQAARDAGLDDNDEYVQELLDQYWTYTDNIKELRDKTLKQADSAMKDLIDRRIAMIKQEAEDEKKSLNDRLTAYKDFASKQKNLLSAAYDEDTYLKEQAEKRKAVSDLQIRLDQLELDNSAWATRRKIELMEELRKAQEELDDFEQQHAREQLEKSIDQSAEIFEKGIKSQTEAIDNYISHPYLMRQQAIEDLQNAGQEMFDAMTEYNREHGSGIDNDITQAWTEAYKAMEQYFDAYGEYYENIKLQNVTGVDMGGTWDEHPLSQSVYNAAHQAATSAVEEVVEKTANPYGNVSDINSIVGYGAYGQNVRAIQYALKELGYFNAEVDGGFGPITKTALKAFQAANGISSPDGIFGKYTREAFKKLGYSSGTRYATPGVHRVDERGDEYVFTSADGSRYRMFSGGEHVLTAAQTGFIYDFARSGGHILDGMINAAVADRMAVEYMRGGVGEINMGDIIIEGNADMRTVSEIRRAQRESMDYMLDRLAKLK